MSMLEADDSLVAVSSKEHDEGSVGEDQFLIRSNSNGDLTRRFVSRHRQELDRIKTDAAHSRSYPVPDRFLLPTTPSSAEHTSTTRACCNRAQIGFRNYFTRDDWLGSLLPAWRWLRVYEWKTSLPKDLIAGLTVGVMVIPQSMSYAKLAGLPVEYGLYSAFMPVYTYALFGSSRQLAVGPVAIVSLLLASGLGPIMEKENLAPGDDGYDTMYTALAVQTAFFVGVITTAMGLAQLGFITVFLSHAVISGFTTGASIIIGSSQLKFIFGYSTAQANNIIEIYVALFEEIQNFNYKTFLMGTSATALLMLMKHLGKTYKYFKWTRALGPLTVTIIAIVLVVAFDLENRGIPIVGTIPKGLPDFTANLWFPIATQYVGNLMVVVATITIVGFMESIAIGKQLASKHKYEIDSSLELIGLGMSNFVGSMFQSYPVTGSFSRSAVNNDSGAQSGISGMITATLVVFVLLFLTSVFEKLPLNILAAIVIAGVIGLLDYPEAIYLWKVHKFDFAVWCSAFLGTLLLGVEIGLGIAVVVSILIVVYEAAYPHTAVLGRLPGTTVYRNIKQYPEAERYDSFLIVRIDAPLFFANAQNVREKIRKYRQAAEKAAEEHNRTVKFVILDLTPVAHIDTSALHILEDMLANHKSRGQQLIFSNPSLAVMDRLVASGFADRVGRKFFFSCSHDAVQYCLGELDVEALSEYESVQDKGSNTVPDTGRNSMAEPDDAKD